MPQENDPLISSFLSHSSIDELNRKREEKAKIEAAQKEMDERYRVATNKIFGSENGKFWLRMFLVKIGYHSFDKSYNPAMLVRDGILKGVYLQHIRPYLKQEIRAEVES